MTKVVLITGGAGFIGSHLIKYMLKKYSDYLIINLDALTYAANLKRLEEIDDNKNYKFYHGNICDDKLLNRLFNRYEITDIVHLAGESSVDNSIENPRIFVETNIIGTFALLEEARKYLLHKNLLNKFIHFSTDEVYGSLGKDDYFSEKTTYNPTSPYSATKASSDFLVKSYINTYNFPAILTHSGNNYGPNQFHDKLIPTIIRNALLYNRLQLYSGTDQHIRDWIYVFDCCSAIDIILHKGVIGENYCIGANNEKTNIEILTLICGFLDEIKPLHNKSSYLKEISYIDKRPSDDYRYAIDNSKLCSELGWRPSFTFLESLKDTVKWYVENEEWI